MPPRVDRVLFGRIPFGNEQLKAGTKVKFPAAYIKERDGTRTIVSGGEIARVTKVELTQFEVLKGQSPETLDATNTDHSKLEVLDWTRFFRVTKIIRWSD